MLVKRRMFFMIARIIMVFFGGLIVATVIALRQVNLETMRRNVIAVLREATNMPVEVDGAVSWKFSLRPQIELNDVRIPNADWAKCKYAFTADKIDVKINLISLFQNRPTIQNIKVMDVNVCVEQNSKGDLSFATLDDKNDVDASQMDAEQILSEEKSDKKYPFADPGMGGIEISNMTATIFGQEYSVAGFNLRAMAMRNNREYSGWIKSDEKVFPFIVSFYEYSEQHMAYPMRVAFSVGGDALIADLMLDNDTKMPTSFKVRGDIPDVAQFGRAIGVTWPEVPKLSIDLVGGLNPKRVLFSKSSMTVRGTDLTFSGYYDWSGKKPDIQIKLESQRISLSELFPDLFGTTWTRPNRELNVFHDMPLYGKEMLGLNLNLQLNVKNFIPYRELSIQNLNAGFKLRNAHVRADVSARVGGGNLKVGANADIRADGRMYITAATRGTNVSVGKILTQVRTNDFISDLPVTIKAYLVANGRNMSEIMHTINGPVQLYSTDAGYAHSALVANVYGTDFLTSLRHSIRDFMSSEKKSDQMRISCVVLNTKLRDGILETQNGVAIETNAIDVRLAGTLDLGEEEMKMSLITVPVRGIKLSLTGNVVNSIEISGNLAEPDVKISGAAVAGKVASATGLGLLLAPFTGGLGLVAGAGVGLIAGDLLENWLADSNPCETAMTRGARAQRGDAEWINAPIDDLIGEMIK